MIPSYKDTKAVAKCGGSSCVYLNKIWGLEPGDMVDFEVTKVDDPGYYALATRKVSKDKTSVILYLDKDWGFQQGDKVFLKVTPRANLDRGVRDQEED